MIIFCLRLPDAPQPPRPRAPSGPPLPEAAPSPRTAPGPRAAAALRPPPPASRRRTRAQLGAGIGSGGARPARQVTRVAAPRSPPSGERGKGAAAAARGRVAAARHLGSPRGRRQAEGLSQPLAAPAGSAAGMSQVPRKLPQEEGDEEEEEEEEIVGLAGYADGAESFSDGDAESGGDEACECCQPRPVRAWGGGAGLRGAGRSRAGSRAGGGVSGSGGGCRGLSEGCRAATGCAGGGRNADKALRGGGWSPRTRFPVWARCEPAVPGRGAAGYKRQRRPRAGRQLPVSVVGFAGSARGPRVLVGGDGCGGCGRPEGSSAAPQGEARRLRACCSRSERGFGNAASLGSSEGSGDVHVKWELLSNNCRTKGCVL